MSTNQEDTMQTIDPTTVTEIRLGDVWWRVRPHTLRLGAWGFTTTPVSPSSPMMGAGVGFIDDATGDWLVVSFESIQEVRCA
jgi:hypothetical protein